MPDSVELNAKITADSQMLTDALERSRTKISAVKREAEGASGGLGKMAKAGDDAAIGASDLSSGMGKLQQAIGKVSPEMGNFARLLDPKLFTGAAAGLGAMGAAAGALLMVMERLGGAFASSLVEPAKRMDDILAAAEKMHAITRQMDQSDAKLLGEIQGLARKQERTAEELGRLQTLIAKARARGYNIDMSTSGDTAGVQEAIDQQARDAYAKQVSSLEAQMLAQRNKIDALQKAADTMGGIRSFMLASNPLGWLSSAGQKGLSALGLDPAAADLTTFSPLLRTLPKTQEDLAAARQKMSELEAQMRVLRRDNPAAEQAYQRGATESWRARTAAGGEAAPMSPEEAAAMEYARQERAVLRNGGMMAGWSNGYGEDFQAAVLEYLQRIAGDTLRVAKEE